MEAVAKIGKKVRELKQNFAYQAQLAFEENLISKETFNSILRTT